MTTTQAILDHLRSLGWEVEVAHSSEGGVEMTAWSSLRREVVRSDEVDELGEYRCACLLAQACGVELEDG